jgi:AmiR/NasT family two-component response regulator
MTAQRLIQNFRQSRGILWATADLTSDTLEKTLAKLGVGYVRLESVEGVSLDPNRDILFIDGDQFLDPSHLSQIGSSLPPVPAIGIVGVEAPSRLKLLAEVGVTAFLRKPIHAAAIYSALFLGVNNYRRMRDMESRIAEHDRRRHGRRFVIKAVVALVQSRGLSDDEAYGELRRESMRRRVGIEEFCEALLCESGSTFPAAWPEPQDAAGSSSQPREYGDASHFNDGCRRDGDARTDDDVRTGSGSDQAWRA